MVGEFKGVSVLRRAGNFAGSWTLSTGTRSFQTVESTGFSSSVKDTRELLISGAFFFPRLPAEVETNIRWLIILLLQLNSENQNQRCHCSQS